MKNIAEETGQESASSDSTYIRTNEYIIMNYDHCARFAGSLADDINCSSFNFIYFSFRKFEYQFVYGF